ncbi:MAG: DUF4038 domain-containing protein [Chloroflexi bacterium]|nr:MAG: DUF4038 domain-containing protein [Chloroflexota bacterium]
MPSGDALFGLLADTWWFGLTQRLSEGAFKDLAALRAEQGFSAVQLVVGIPPEVGPANENARSPVGFPWTLEGEINAAYLAFARDRIAYLNRLGLTVIVYGAWGHQIEWLGREGMIRWWLRIVETLDALDVVYCLCGESNLWVGEASKLLPARSTDDLVARRSLALLPRREREFLVRAVRTLRRPLDRRRREARRSAWSRVLEEVARRTDRPILIHPVPDETGYEAVNNPHLLAANTLQTGHDPRARNRLWQQPLALLREGRAPKGLINLEPWYEGIQGRFWAEDQLFAYWVTMLAGAMGYCYGAHGIWNVGDGRFLAHWGPQTFAQALALETPRLLGLSHQQCLRWVPRQGRTFYQTAGEKLLTIGREGEGRVVQFFPDVVGVGPVPVGRYWLPLAGAFVEQPPLRGPVVVFRDGTTPETGSR